MKKLNLGCGEDYREGWVNLDSRKGIKTDVLWNIENYPYPFKANTFEQVLMSMILEHTVDPIKTLKEIVRICKNGAKLIVTAPHINSYAAHSDLQHKHYFTENMFDDWHLKEYGLEELKFVNYEFLYHYKYKKYVPMKRFLKIYLNGIYDDIKFEFRVKKS